jgi:phosphoribosyl 1,2-cyclic phosphate phosphodiesterase
MAYLTDFKSISASEKEKLADLDLLILSALHHESHHSHSNLKESIAFAQEVAATKTLFTHMSHHMGPHGATSKLLPDSIQLAFDGLTVVI